MVKQLIKTSPSFQADYQHPTSPPSKHHNLTPDLKQAMVIILCWFLWHS